VTFDWPWCPPAAPDQAIELRITLDSLGRFADVPPAAYVPYRERPARAPGAPPVVRVLRGPDGHLRVAYADGATFVVDATASEIHGVAGGALTRDDLLVYLQGPVLGLVLRLRGVLCLHASAAVLDGRAFGVVGAGGMGKSTSAAIFARRGLPVLADDVLALDERPTGFEAQPGLPRVLLWPEAVRALYGDGEALPRVVDGWDKRFLDLTAPGHRFAARPAPLAALYVLGARLPGDGAPSIAPLRGAEAARHLLAHTYANDLLDGRQRARELEALGRLASRVAVRAVRAADDRRRAPEVCEAILADLQALGDHARLGRTA
jgi:hypothetical protein